jgi:hypothetical protein
VGGDRCRPASRDERGRVRGRERSLLTGAQVNEIRRRWAAGETVAEITAATGLSVCRLKARLRDQLADLPQRDRRFGSGRRPAPPTEQEIHERAAMLRRSWPPDRWLGHEPGESP